MEVLMAEKNKQKSIVSGNVLRDLGDYFRLVLRLMGDGRVNPLLKLLPIGTIAYLLNPIDIPGPIDDLGVITLGLYMFVEMCPPNVVEEHRQALRGVISGSARDPEEDDFADEDIIDAEYREERK